MHSSRFMQNTNTLEILCILNYFKQGRQKSAMVLIEVRKTRVEEGALCRLGGGWTVISANL